MNTNTNELVNSELFERLAKDEKKKFEPVPEDLNQAAKKALGKKERVTISRNSGGKLSTWAAQKRKVKRKQQRQSRKRNH